MGLKIRFRETISYVTIRIIPDAGPLE